MKSRPYCPSCCCLRPVRLTTAASSIQRFQALAGWEHSRVVPAVGDPIRFLLVSFVTGAIASALIMLVGGLQKSDSTHIPPPIAPTKKSIQFTPFTQKQKLIVGCLVSGVSLVCLSIGSYMFRDVDAGAPIAVGGPGVALLIAAWLIRRVFALRGQEK